MTHEFAVCTCKNCFIVVKIILWYSC